MTNVSLAETRSGLSLEAGRSRQRRALLRRCASLPAVEEASWHPSPMDFFVLSHPAVQDLVARLFPRHSGLVHVSQDLEVIRPADTGDTYACTARLIAVRSTGAHAAMTVGCDLVGTHGPVAHLTAQIRLNDVDVTPFEDLDGLGGAPAAPRPRTAADGQDIDVDITFRDEDVIEYADLSGDHNPIHLDDDAARAAGFDTAIVHGMAVVSAAAEAAGDVLDLAAESRLRLSVRFSAATPVGATSTCRMRVSTDRTGVSFKVTGPLGVSAKNGFLGRSPRE